MRESKIVRPIGSTLFSGDDAIQSATHGFASIVPAYRFTTDPAQIAVARE
jgi:hypothetical protein